MFMSLLVTVEPLLATCCLGGDPDLDPWLTTFVSLWLFSCDIDCELSLEGCFDWLTATTDSAAVEEATLRLEGAEESSPTPAGGAGVEADDPLVISCCWAKLLLLLFSKVWSKTRFLLGEGCPWTKRSDTLRCPCFFLVAGSVCSYWKKCNTKNNNVTKINFGITEKWKLSKPGLIKGKMML